MENNSRKPMHSLKNAEMTEPVRKYLTEFGLHMFLDYAAILQQDQLSNLPANFPDSHIYMICRRPRVMLDETITVDTHTVSGRFAVFRGEEQEFHSYSVPNHLGTTAITLTCPYPYTKYFVRDTNGNLLSDGMTSLLLSPLAGVDPTLFKLEVLYVGQAYGRDGRRYSPQRLRNHSTLQAIYFDAMQETLDKEVWIVLCHFEELLLQTTDPRSPRIERSADQEAEHVREIFAKVPVREELAINFTEAGLIRYFQPKYNVHFKDTFPSRVHESYAECYDLDVNSLSIEINSENIYAMLYSDVVQPDWTHTARYPLYSTQERRDMFDIAGLMSQ